MVCLDMVQRAPALVDHPAGGRLSHRMAFLAPARSHSLVPRRAGMGAVCRGIYTAGIMVSLSALPKKPQHPPSRCEPHHSRRGYRVLLRAAEGLGADGGAQAALSDVQPDHGRTPARGTGVAAMDTRHQGDA